MFRDVHEICLKIRSLLEEAVKRNLAEGILLSGGLDTSILAFITSKFTPLKAFTVAFNEGPALDVEYAKSMAEELGLNHTIHRFGRGELYASIPQVIEALGSFDPMEVRNSVSIYIGLKTAKESKVWRVMTGDGADELFAGYSFLFKLDGERLDLELRRIWKTMSFSSIILAEALGMDVKTPYLDSEFGEFVVNIDSKYKIRAEDGKVYGKWILRKAYEDLLPKRIIWRSKVPIEYGTGTTILPKLFDKEVSEQDFKEKKRKYLREDKVKIRDKEHLIYYEFYKSIFGPPYSLRRKKGRICPYCKASVPKTATYCRTCGAYPI